MQCYLRLLLVALLAGSGAGGFGLPMAAAESLVGTWTGKVHQVGLGFHEVIMTFTSATQGTIKYPSLDCGGTLEGGGSGKKYQFTEIITYGAIQSSTATGCAPRGTIRIRLKDATKLYWEWTGVFESKKYQVLGTFTRNKASTH